MESKDLLSKFSFQDVLAYFFPGVVLCVGIATLFNQIDLFDYSKINIDVFEGFVFFLVCFVVGVVTSGFSHPLIKLLDSIKKAGKPENTIQLEALKPDLIVALKKEFEINIVEENWNEEYFFLCRDTVYEFMPGGSSAAFRQGGLRLLRGYMMFPTLIWTVNAIVYGCALYKTSNCLSIGIIIISIIVGVLILSNLWNRMYQNRIREVKYTLISFISLSKLNIVQRER